MNATQLREARTFEILLSANLAGVADVVAWADRNILAMEHPEHVFLELAALGASDWLQCWDMLRRISNDRGVPDLLLGVFAQAVEAEAGTWRPVCRFMWRHFNGLETDTRPAWEPLAVAGVMLLEEDCGYHCFDMRLAELESRMCLKPFLGVDTSSLGLDARSIAMALDRQCPQ